MRVPSNTELNMMSFSELSSILDHIYFSDPRLKPNNAMHDYQLTYPPAILLENAEHKCVPTAKEFDEFAIGKLRNTALYFHFGFCEYKCRYCHHYEISTTSKEEQMARYLDGMLREMEAFRQRQPNLKKLIYFLGGGTPTSLPAHLLEKFLYELVNGFGRPTSSLSTVEVKPVTATEEKLNMLVKAGFQRINLGVQTLDPELYSFHHHKESLSVALEAIDRARACGFKFINIDILTGLEEQSAESWAMTLNAIKSLIDDNKIDSVFIYPFHDDPRSKTFQKDDALPSAKDIAYSEHLARKMFSELDWTELGTRFFRAPHHRRRELSDFIRSRANPSYGELIYHGFGNSSFSVGDRATYINHRKIEDYLLQVDNTGLGIQHWEKLDNKQRATRDLTFDILYSPLVRVRSIRNKYGADSMAAHIQQINAWTELGLGTWNKLLGIWRLNNLGKLVHQQMISALYLNHEKHELDKVMTRRASLGRAYRGY